MTRLWVPARTSDAELAALLERWPADEVVRSVWIAVATWEVVG